MKPRIKREFGTWMCQEMGEGRDKGIGTGQTPRIAYSNHLINKLAHIYMEGPFTMGLGIGMMRWPKPEDYAPVEYSK